MPLSEKPKLSDPSEFSMDVTERGSDEVDAFVEESIDIPEINNEVNLENEVKLRGKSK